MWLQDIAKPGSVDKAPFFGHELKGAGLGYPGECSGYTLDQLVPWHGIPRV